MAEDSNLLDLLGRLNDVRALVEVLIGDVVDSVQAVHPQRPGTRRSYVRTVFALIEGAQSGMSTYLLEAHTPYAWQLSDEEKRVFWDAVPDASRDRPAGGRAKLIQRLKVLFKSGRRIFGEHCQLDFGGAGFQAFHRSVLVRDRLMHPKRSQDLEVGDEELKDIDRARDWFRTGARRFFEGAAIELRTRIKS